MTDSDLDAIRERARAWRAVYGTYTDFPDHDYRHWALSAADDIDALLAWVAALETEIVRLRGGLVEQRRMFEEWIEDSGGGA